MSLEQSIAALTAQAGLLLDLPAQITATAQARIADITAAYNARIAGLTVEVYINALTGNDANAGTGAGVPLRTIERALALTPFGGRCVCRLQTDYTISADILVDYRTLTLFSDTAVQRNLNFTRLLDQTVAPNLRNVTGFRLNGTVLLQINGLTINVPAIDGAWASYGPGSKVALISSLQGQPGGNQAVNITNTALNIPTASFAILGYTPLSLYMAGITLPGATTSLNGRLIDGYASTSGVATNTVPFLVTNLLTI